MLYSQGGKLYHTLKGKRDALLSILKLRKDKRHRIGVLQGAVSFDVINQYEWYYLTCQVKMSVLEPEFHTPASDMQMLAIDTIIADGRIRFKDMIAQLKKEGRNCNVPEGFIETMTPTTLTGPQAAALSAAARSIRISRHFV